MSFSRIFIDILSLMKLRPLPRCYSLFAMLEYPARMAVSGRILSVQRDIHTFTMTVQQYTMWSTVRCLKVRALLGFSTEMASSIRVSPFWACNISLTGWIAAFKDGVVIIVVDGLMHLPSALQRRANFASNQ